MADFFGSHTHCTKFSGLTSAFLFITASVIQLSSAIGPASFVVNNNNLTQPMPHQSQQEIHWPSTPTIHTSSCQLLMLTVGLLNWTTLKS